MQYPANAGSQKDDDLLNTLMQYTLKGTLNTQDPSVRAYALVLASRLRTKPMRQRITAKMLYWLENPGVELMYPIVVTQHHKGITGVHPGQTRFLAAVLLNRSWPCVLRTVCSSTSVLLNPIACNELASTAQQIDEFDRCIRTHYEPRAQVLERKYPKLQAIDFYAEILGVSLS